MGRAGARPARVTGLSGVVVINTGNTAVIGVDALNEENATRFLHLYDHAEPIVGTTVPLLTLTIPPGDGTTISESSESSQDVAEDGTEIYGQLNRLYTVPIQFDVALSAAITTTIDGTGIPYNDVVAFIHWDA